MKLIDHVNTGNRIKDCLGVLSNLKPKIAGSLGQNCIERVMINKAITEINNLRMKLNDVLVKEYPEVDSTNFVYFGMDRSILVKSELSKTLLLPIPKEELLKKQKKTKG